MLSVYALWGCTPELNWRHVSSTQNQVQVLMPCKPDQATRTVDLQVNTKQVSSQLHMQACEAGKMHFALAELAVPKNASAHAVQEAWRLASLATLEASATQAVTQPARIKGAPTAEAMETRVLTPRHQAHWVWLITEQTIYQAAIYAAPNDKGFAEATDVYMSGIQWR